MRYGGALLAGRRISLRVLEGMVRDVLATRAEFGEIGGEQQRLLQGTVLDAEARQALDQRRWRRMVRKAYAETRYYRRRLDDLGLTPDDLVLDRAAELPPTPKAAIRAMPEAFVSDRSTPVFQAWTTGTTGMPTAVWFSRYELRLAAGLSALSMMMSAGVGPEDVVQMCLSSRALLGIDTIMQACRLIGAAAFLNGLVEPAETLSRLATPVHLPGKKPRTSMISIVPSYLAALVQTAEQEGYRPADFGLDWIVCGGEVLSDSLRARAEEVFGAEVIDNYAMTETLPVAGLACEQRHLHLTVEQGLVEVLDPVTFAPARPGEVGMLVVTPYAPYRETTLVLRLATGDLVRCLPDEPRSCELAGLPATSRLLGRAAGPDGPGMYTRDVLNLLEAERAVPLPCRYAVEPAADGADLHVLVERADPALRARLEERAADRGLPLRKLVLHTDLDSMPPIEFARAFLRETTVVRDVRSGRWSLR
jgi:phenylacetate-coenzyme A ligase PaaK-like adenylate-forming protein